MATFTGDLLRILARGGMEVGTHALMAPILAKAQTDRLQRMEEAKNLWGMASTAEEKDLPAISQRLKELTGRGLVQTGGAETQAPTGPLGGTFLPKLVEKLSGGPVPQPETQAAEARFLRPQRTLEQHLGAAFGKLPPEQQNQLLAIKLKGEMSPGEQVAKILQAQKQESGDKFKKQEIDIKQMNADTQRALLGIHAETALANAQNRGMALKLLGQKVENVGEQNALKQVEKANEDYLKVLSIGGKDDAKVSAADAYNAARKRAIEKYPNLAGSMGPEIPIEETSVDHWWNKYGLGSGPETTTVRKVAKPGSKPSGESAEAKEPKTPTKPVGETVVGADGRTYPVKIVNGKKMVDTDNPIK